MGSQDEVLKLIAQVEDKFSRPMVDLQRQLRATAELMDKQFKATHKSTQTQTEDFKALKKVTDEFGQVVQNVVAPAMNKFGLASFSVAAAVAAVVVTVQKWVNLGEHLRQLNIATGMTVNSMKDLMAVGKNVGITNDEMAASFERVNDILFDTKQNIGGLYQLLSTQRDPYYQSILQKIKAAKNEDDAIAIELKALDHMKDPAAKRKFLSAAGLDSRLANMTPGERATYLAE